jgi:hypothetical protein
VLIEPAFQDQQKSFPIRLVEGLAEVPSEIEGSLKLYVRATHAFCIKRHIHPS